MASKEDNQASLSCGLHVRFCGDLPTSLTTLVFNGPFSFLVTPLVHPRLVRDGQAYSTNRDVPLTRSDLILDSQAWNTCVVGSISAWIDCDSPSAKMRKASCLALREELNWATHLSLSAVVLPTPRLDAVNLSNTLNQMITSCLQHPALWITVPLLSDDAEVSWLAWNALRVRCEHSSSLAVILELGDTLPSRRVLAKWQCEPVRAVKIPTSVFLSNSKGYPVLSQAHQQAFAMLYERDAQPVLTGRPGHADGMAPYYMYLDHLIRRLPKVEEKDEFERPFYDYLQSPLQPLGDNLESQMYETFEKCPVKYEQYERAIELALLDKPQTANGPNIVVMVMGAGRGPLVRCALRAAVTTGHRIKIYAVEKNSNAVITLRNMKEMMGWGETVTIVHQDMREWKAPEMADILVSELLGSWGDNELSPECLDGAEKFLNPSGGVSIPCEYTSFVEPISTPKLWRACKDFANDKHMETMYVVKLHQFSSFAPPKPMFTFAHPSWHKNTVDDTFDPSANNIEAVDNSRFGAVEFVAEQTATLHGFGGYFECKLYKDIMISINPPTFSNGMLSWFPMYIPVHAPLLVRKGDMIKAHFWRHVDSTKVWYEWSLSAPAQSQIHNVNGQCAPINLKF